MLASTTIPIYRSTPEVFDYAKKSSKPNCVLGCTTYNNVVPHIFSVSLRICFLPWLISPMDSSGSSRYKISDVDTETENLTAIYRKLWFFAG